MTEPAGASTTDPERGGRWRRLTEVGLLAIVGLAVFALFALGPRERQPNAQDASATARALPTASQPGSTAPSPSVSVSPTVGVASPAQSPFTPVIEVAFRHGAPGTLQFVTGLIEADGRRIAAVNVQTSELVSPTGPWGGDGAIYVEQAVGSWTQAETGGVFESIRISYLFAPPDGPFVIYGSVGYSTPTPREVTGVWTSNDAMTWTEVAVEPHNGVIAEGPLGYLQALVTTDESGSATLEIYTSADALVWQPVHTVDLPAGSFVWAAGVGPEGYVVTYDEAGDIRSRVLASADGSTWHAAPEQPSFAADDIVMAISDLGSNWVGAGWSGFDSSAITLWWSADGLNWERVGTLTADVEYFGAAADLFEVDGRLFLNTSLAMEGSETRPAGIWTSLDGRSWEPLDLGPEAEVRSGLATDCCLLLGGRIGIQAGEAAIWRLGPEP